jgi:hypothetical protein
MLNKPFTLPVSRSRPLDFGGAWYLPGTLTATRQASGVMASTYQSEKSCHFLLPSKSGPLRPYQQNQLFSVSQCIHNTLKKGSHTWQ